MTWDGPAFDWTDAAVDELKRQRAEGLPASTIAESLSHTYTHVSRSAVLGKINRLGLSATQTPQRLPRQRRPLGHDGGLASPHSTRTMDAPEPTMHTPNVDDQAIPLEQRRTLMELDATTCRWPVGEGATLFFCGATPVEGFSYCAAHCDRAFDRAYRRRGYFVMRRDAPTAASALR